MVDYPGEQRLYDVSDPPISGSFTWSQQWNAFRPNNPSGPDLTMAAGDDVYIYGYTTWLRATDVIDECNWILELATGGRFEVFTSYDVDYSYEPGTFVWTSLGEADLAAGRHAFPVPMAQRSYDAINNDGGPLFRFKVISGAPVVSGAYMQTEGTNGYQTQAGTDWSDWLTPDLVPRVASWSWVTELYQGLVTDHYTSRYDDAGPDIVNDALAAASVATPFLSGTSSSNGVRVAAGGGVSLESGNPVMGIYVYTADFRIGRETATLAWLTDAQIFRSTPPELQQLRLGRDYLTYEYDPDGESTSVSWQTGYLYKNIEHTEIIQAGDRVPAGSSPHGDTYTFSGIGGFAGSSANIVEMVPGTPGAAFTPSPGEFTIATDTNWFSLGSMVEPSGGWRAAKLNTSDPGIMGCGSGASIALTSSSTWPIGGALQPMKIDVQLPDFRYEIPLYELSPLSIGPSGPSGPTWPSDWYVPGWGEWDWFPDYGWEDYPADPIIDWPVDWYIPLPELPTYHYLPFDLNTNTQLGEIPLEEVSYSHKLSDAGTASFSFPVTPSMLKQQIKQSSIPGKTGLYIIRDNQIVWGGIIWKRMYDSTSRRVRIEAGSFESYFDHRFQSNVLGFEDVDQMTIARTLALQAADEMHIDVDPATSGVNRYYNAFYYDFKTIGGEIDSLASLWDGFDWNVRVYLDETGVVRRRLVWGFPNLGVSAEDTEFLFEYPGNIRTFDVVADADKAGNRLWAIGGGQGLDQIQYEAIDMDQLSAGWPLLETTTSYKDVFDPPRLQARSIQDLERLRPPVTILDVEVDPFSDPILGTYNPGDWARFIIEDHWNNPGIDIKRRIVGYNVSVSATSPLDRVSLQIDAGDET